MHSSVRVERRIVTALWALLVLAVLVVLGGAIVRATGSGDGCGPSWPRCVGQIVPVSPSTETLIELSHRLATGLLGVLAIVTGAMVWRATARRDQLRAAVGVILGLLVIEALIGRTLVLTGWVGTDASIGRAVVVPLHLVNTFLLLGAIAAAITIAAHGRIRLGKGSPARRLLWTMAAGLIIVGATGALNALADTVFPVDSTVAVAAPDLGATAHFLVRLRAIHPFVAAVVGIGVLLLSSRPALSRIDIAPHIRLVRAAVLVQMAVGVLNIAWSTPIVVQVIHLLLADVVWLAVAFMLARVSTAATAEVRS